MLTQSYKTQTTFIEASADFLAEKLLSALKNSDKVSFLVCGGSTPGPIFEKLSEMDLPWERIIIGQVDERWVDEKDKGSNAGLLRKTLLKNKAKDATFIPLKTRAKTAKYAQSKLNDIYSPLLDNPSVVLLGMGLDGHIAAWYPEADGTDKALDKNNTDYVQAIMAKPGPIAGDYLERITLTYAALSKASSALLLIKGKEKMDVLGDIIYEADPKYPLSHLWPDLDDKLMTFHLEQTS